jgi:hypothetical protein
VTLYGLERSPSRGGKPAKARAGRFPFRAGYSGGGREGCRSPSVLALDHPDSDREQQRLQRYGGPPIKGRP